MARTRYGKIFKTRRGRLGRYKYVRGKRVAFVATRRRSNRRFKTKRVYSSDGTYYNRRY